MHRFATFVAVMTFVLILAGGAVTSTRSGDDIPTWPFPIIGPVGIELEHRHIAGTVGLLTMVLAVWLLLRESRSWVRWLGVTAAVLVVAQAGLGGWRVLSGPTPQIAIVHAAVAQAFFCLIMMLAVFTGAGWSAVRQPATRGRRIVAPPLIAVPVELDLPRAWDGPMNNVDRGSHRARGRLPRQVLRQAVDLIVVAAMGELQHLGPEVIEPGRRLRDQNVPRL